MPEGQFVVYYNRTGCQVCGCGDMQTVTVVGRTGRQTVSLYDKSGGLRPRSNRLLPQTSLLSCHLGSSLKVEMLLGSTYLAVL
jgi:hypothetical protein